MVVSALMVTMHVPGPLHAPLQPVNVEPVSAVAVNVITVPAMMTAEQVAPQLMALLVSVTVPLPTPSRVTVTIYVGAMMNVPVICVSAVMVNTHAPKPALAHALTGRLLQPVNAEPVFDAGVNVMTVP